MLKQCNFLLVLSTAMILSAAPLYSQSASLIAAGKKEGKAVVYGSSGIGHRGCGFRRVQEKNRHRRGILARVGNQGHGPGAERIPRRQTALRYHPDQR